MNKFTGANAVKHEDLMDFRLDCIDAGYDSRVGASKKWVYVIKDNVVLQRLLVIYDKQNEAY